MADSTPEEIVAAQIRKRLEAEKKEFKAPCLRSTCPLPRDNKPHNDHIAYARSRVKIAKQNGKIEEAYLIRLAEEDTTQEARWKRLKDDDTQDKYKKRIDEHEEMKRQQMEPDPKPTWKDRIKDFFADFIDALWP